MKFRLKDDIEECFRKIDIWSSATWLGSSEKPLTWNSRTLSQFLLLWACQVSFLSPWQWSGNISLIYSEFIGQKLLGVPIMVQPSQNLSVHVNLPSWHKSTSEGRLASQSPTLPVISLYKAELQSLEAVEKARIRTMPKKMSDTTPLEGLPSCPLHNAG